MNRKRIIVIGGGASGLMAAGQAAALGAEVTVLEKMPRTARKLGITGKGRCNLTNIASLNEFIDHFGRNGRFLRQAFNVFFSRDLITFFGKLGVPTVTERGGRVFPTSEEARDIVTAMNRYAGDNGVKILLNCPVKKILTKESRVTGVTVENNDQIEAAAVILATGGKSYPATGSTGDGFSLVKAMGHTINPARPALVPLVSAGNTAARLQGLSLKNVEAKLLIDGRKKASHFGEMLFTHFGLSGPIILSLSKWAVEALETGQKVSVTIDLKPALDDKKLDSRLQRDFMTHGKRQFKSILKDLLPRTLIPVCIDLTGIDGDKPAHQISAAERRRLRLWLKDFRIEITGQRGFSEAIITAGGISTKEINPRTLESRLVKGLYFAGEIIDIDADTGGYNLQAAFSTGYLAGSSAAAI